MATRRRTKFDGLSPQATKELIALQEDFYALVGALRAETVGNTTDSKQRGTYAARFHERVRALPDAAGLDVVFPGSSPQNQNQWIEVLKIGGGDVRIAATGGTVQGVATFTAPDDGLYRFQSDGAGGWWVRPCCSSGGGGGEAFPVGSIYISVNSTDPATTLGYGTWAAFGAGRVPVGFAAGDPDFGTDEGTGGAKTVASAGTNTAITAGTPTGTCSAPTFTGSSASTNLVSAGTPSGTNSAPTFTGAAMANHTHELPFQLVSATVTRQLPAATFGTGTSRTSQGQDAAHAANATAAAVALAESRSAGTPSGTVSAPTFTGSALGTHQHTVTATGTVSAPTFTGSPMATHNHAFTGSATSVLQPFITVRMWKRTA